MSGEKRTREVAFHSSGERTGVPEVSEFRQANGLDGVRQDGLGLELEQRHVERLFGRAGLVVLRVDEDLLDLDLLLARLVLVVSVVLPKRHLGSFL